MTETKAMFVSSPVTVEYRQENKIHTEFFNGF